MLQCKTCEICLNRYDRMWHKNGKWAYAPSNRGPKMYIVCWVYSYITSVTLQCKTCLNRYNRTWHENGKGSMRPPNRGPKKYIVCEVYSYTSAVMGLWNHIPGAFTIWPTSIVDSLIHRSLNVKCAKKTSDFLLCRYFRSPTTKPRKVLGLFIYSVDNHIIDHLWLKIG